MTSTRHIPTGRVVENRRAFQDHVFDSLSSAMEMRHDGSNIGLALLFHCSHALCVMLNLFLLLTYLLLLVLLMIGGYGETDWPTNSRRVRLWRGFGVNESFG